MAVHIRLARHGTKKAPFFRIVVTDHRNPRDGSHLENIGTFHPANEGVLNLDRSRLEYWQSKGAQPSHTLSKLLKKNPATPAQS